MRRGARRWRSRISGSAGRRSCSTGWRSALGTAPPVVDAEAVRADPEGVLRRLCAALGLGFDRGMLAWPAGARASDGVWAAHWYAAVVESTGFAAPEPEPAPLAGRMRGIAEAARRDYERLRAHAL